MQLHQLKPTHKRKKAKRVGRGGKRGTYSGRGMKGQKSRSGHRLAPIVRELIKKYPKKRGYRFKSKNTKPAIINIKILAEKFQAKDKITPQILIKKELVKKMNGKIPAVKILGTGTIKKELSIKGCFLSKTAKEKIEKAGGAVS